jgi:hypothetical protein
MANIGDAHLGDEGAQSRLEILQHVARRTTSRFRRLRLLPFVGGNG